MTESQIVMNFTEQYPELVEPMVERAIAASINKMFEDERTGLRDVMMVELQKSVRQTFKGNGEEITCEVAERLERRLLGERLRVKRMVEDLHKRVRNLEDKGDGADWWKLQEDDEE